MAKAFIGALYISTLLQIRGEMYWRDGNLGRRELQCDGFPFDIECPGGDVIKILTAHYGRLDEKHCGSFRATNFTTCDLANAKEIVASRCNNRTQCIFDITGSMFPDPCPGVGKYLEVIYDCVKFLFKCPGRLSGLGKKTSKLINASPQVGSWSRDPVMNPDRVYFTTASRVLHEYSDIDDFIEGIPLKTYNLPSKVTAGNAVIYDRNLYYVKDKSKNIIRYSLITRKRTKEYAVPAGVRPNENGKISLHVDETGLWVTYDNSDGRMVVMKLSKDSLTPENSWVTNLPRSQNLHSFIICGTFYSVSPATGIVDYSYDTNAFENREKSGLGLRFYQENKLPFRRRQARTTASFLSYNASVTSYNPRDRRLYLWDAGKAQAISFLLRFEHSSDAKQPGQPASSEDHSTTKRPPIIPQTSSPPPEAPANKPVDTCRFIVDKGMEWSAVRAGEIARQDCMDGTGGVATWRCVKLDNSGAAEWDKEGPRMPQCVTWINEIAANYHRGKADLAVTIDILQQGASQRLGLLPRKDLEVLIRLTKHLLQNAYPPRNEASAKRIVRATVRVVSSLIESNKAWDFLDVDIRNVLVNDLMASIEAAALLFLGGPATRVPQNPQTLQAFDENVLLHATSVQKIPWNIQSSDATRFPDLSFCETNSFKSCGDDIVTVPDGMLPKQRSDVKPGVIFTIYCGLAKLLHTAHEVDSNVVSATAAVANEAPLFFNEGQPQSARVTLKHSTDSTRGRRCAVWTFSDRAATGNWTSESCNTLSSNASHTTCECRDLGHYALILSPASSEPHSIEPNSNAYEESLEITTSAGSAVAIICFMACAITLLLLRNLNGDLHMIHKNVALCSLLAEVTFLVGINQTGDRVGCAAVAALLQYAIMAAFTWIILESVQLYRMLVDMFDDESRWKLYYAAGYGVPTVVVAISLGTGYQDYGTATACFIEPRSGIMLLPIISTLAAIVATAGVLCAVIYRICTASLTFTSSEFIAETRTCVKKSFVVLFLQVTTWIIAISWINERTILLATLFCLSNAGLGIASFVSYCIFPNQVRNEYKQIFDRIDCKGGSPKESYVERSSTFQRSYVPARFTPNESDVPETPATQQYSPWQITSPKTMLSSPEDAEFLSNTYETRDRSTAGCRMPRSETQHSRDSEHMTARPHRHRESRTAGRNFKTSVSDARRQHRHSDYFHGTGFETRPDPDRRKYKTGLPTAPRLHLQQRSCTMVINYPTNTNPHIKSKSHRPLLHNLVPHEGQNNVLNNSVPPHRHFEPRMIRSQRIGDSILDTVGHRELPPNSIIQQLRNEFLTHNEPADCFRPITNDSSEYNEPSQIIHEPPSRFNSKRNSHIRHDMSDDEGKGSSVEAVDMNTSSYFPSGIVTEVAYEDIQLSPHQTNFRYSRNMTPDPRYAVENERGLSRDDFHAAGHRRQWSHQEMLV